MLIPCPQCNAMVSDLTANCTHCGSPFKAGQQASKAEQMPDKIVAPEGDTSRVLFMMEHKSCPKCYEYVRAEAHVCPWCQTPLTHVKNRYDQARDRMEAERPKCPLCGGTL